MTISTPHVAATVTERRAPATSRPGELAHDVRIVAPAVASVRALAGAPWAPATWRAVSLTTVGFVWLTFAFLVAVVLVPTGLALLVVVVGFAVLAGLLALAGPFAAVERARLRATLGVTIPAPRLRPTAGVSVPRAAWHVVADGRRWLHVAYAAVGAVLTWLALAVLAGLGGGGIGTLVTPAYAARVPHPWWQVAGLVVLGVLAVWLAAVGLQLLALLQVRLARGLLGPGAAAVIAESAERQVTRLRSTRERAVDAADSERRRIERDLHDGAQQRLVALGVELGAARRAAQGDPETAALALDHAHGEVKEVLAELRDLVRGIHPAVLTDRGLDAALSALAARSPVPVEVTVGDAAAVAAASPAAQAAAYFVAAEALTNVARHSRATRAWVVVDAVVGVLVLDVGDDGVGGATAVEGRGLAGLRGRVEALDGRLTLSSPPGGGTVLRVEVPCAS